LKKISVYDIMKEKSPEEDVYAFAKDHKLDDGL
jgi:hypothetical protein